MRPCPRPVAPGVASPAFVAVMGGTSSRGHTLRALQGASVYGDHCDGRVRALLLADDGVHHHELDAISRTERLHRIGPAGGPEPTG